MNDTLLNFAKHILFLQTGEITSYEFSNKEILNLLIDIIQNIHLDVEEGILTPEIAFFHVYIYAMQINGRDEGFDTVKDLKKLESLHDLHSDEKEEVLTSINEALRLYTEALAYSTEIQKIWKDKWIMLIGRLKDARYLYAENNILIFE